tara:strand:- start:35771 stop:36022 length:252 start_codon:yes stop_codon:yes gene_type:complete
MAKRVNRPLAYGLQDHRVMRAQSTSRRVQISTKRRSSISILATPSMPGRSAAIGPSSIDASTSKTFAPFNALEIGVIRCTATR